MTRLCELHPVEAASPRMEAFRRRQDIGVGANRRRRRPGTDVVTVGGQHGQRITSAADVILKQSRTHSQPTRDKVRSGATLAKQIRARSDATRLLLRKTTADQELYKEERWTLDNCAVHNFADFIDFSS